MQVKPSRNKFLLGKTFFWIILGLFVAIVFVFAIITAQNKKSLTVNNSVKQSNDTTTALTQQQQNEINNQLLNAKNLLSENRKDEALTIYAQLSQQNVAQAMFQYANLALQNKNTNIDCSQAFSLLVMASDKDYLPAKTTLGFLYSFADNDDLMKEHNYFIRCSIPKNIYKGAQLLMESTLEGDFTAAYWLNKLNSADK